MSIRPACQDDIPAMLQIYGPYVQNTAYSFEYTVPTVQDFTRRFLDYTSQFPWLVWEENGAVLGYAYGSAPFQRAAYQWCAEVSVYIAPQAQHRGIGKALYAVLEALLFLQGYQVIYSLISTANPGSVEFHRRLGYTPVAEMPRCGFKLGNWWGIVYMEKRSKSVVLPTNPPVAANTLVQDKQLFSEILGRLAIS